MTHDTVIRAENLGKKYIIGHQAERESYTALRDTITRNARNLLRKTADVLRGRGDFAGETLEEFWALKNLTFEVKRGDVIGVIGRNGAGKSTLLKVLSRITEPSDGRVTISGRVASLLEVGTGFHPELTGRENIFLNGAILGMSRSETRRKFDEIVEFADVEKFLDTPVKRYSSGMYVRLAFAVAAFIDSEILIVDEVLAVGDANFQKKCLGKMSDVASGGRTVLFVSHSMATIRNMCTSAILLNNGQIEHRGTVQETIAKYMSQGACPTGGVIDLSRVVRKGTGHVRIEDVHFPGMGSSLSFQVYEDIRIAFRLRAQNPDDMPGVLLWVLFRNVAGEDTLMMMQRDTNLRLPRAHRAEVHMSTNIVLAPGRYSISFGVENGSGNWDWIDDAVSIEVDKAFYNGGGHDFRLGNVYAKADWRIIETDSA